MADSIGIDSLLGEGTMPAAYSADIRGRVIASVESGSSRREAAEEFDVSASSAIKWVAAYRTTGSCAAKPRGGSTSPLEKYTTFLLTLIEGQPDLTLDEVVCAMRKRKLPGSRTAVWRFFQRHKITFKKRMARPVRKWFRDDNLTSLHQRIRSRGGAPGQDGDPRVPVLIKASASMRHFLNQGSRTPVDCQAISLSTTRKHRRPISASRCAADQSGLCRRRDGETERLVVS